MTKSSKGLDPSSASTSTLAAHPWIGIVAVLLGAFIATLTSRLSTFGLADIRGAVHAGVDEGAWITTAQTVTQMLIGPIAVWLGRVFGTRRVLLAGGGAFIAAEILAPLSPNLPCLLVAQALSGLGSGCFIPLTIGFVVQNLPVRLWAFGIAVYALNLETSLNVSASLEGWWVEHASWKWIFWQNIPIAIGMMWCVVKGIPSQAVDRTNLRRADRFGMLSFGLALSLLYAALDQGNRLDWLNSGVIVGLLVGSVLLMLFFVIHEMITAEPWLNLRVAISGNLPILLLLIAVVRLAVLSTAYLIPQFLVAVRGYRALEVGPVLLWIAAPQLLCAALAGFFLRRVDARIPAAVGLGCVSIACYSVAHGITADWASEDFIPSQLLQAVGQSLAVASVIFVGVLNMRPADAATFGVLLQTSRLLGGEAGLAAISTFVRKDEQLASLRLGSFVSSGDSGVMVRLSEYVGALVGRSGSTQAYSQAQSLLGSAVRTQANLYSYMDGFLAIAICMVLALFILALLRSTPPHPAGPVAWRWRRHSA